MLPLTITPNECAPSRGKAQGAVDFVLTPPLPSQKDRDHDLYHIGCARRKTR